MITIPDRDWRQLAARRHPDAAGLEDRAPG